MVRYAKDAAMEMALGIGLWGALWSVVLLFVSDEKLPALLGLWFGCLAALAMMLHMVTTLETAMDLYDPDSARKKASSGSVLRYFVLFGAVILAWKSGFFNLLTIFVGVFGLKISAYLQPLLHKVLTGLRSKKERKE